MDFTTMKLLAIIVLALTTVKSGPVRNSNTLSTHLTLSRYQREIAEGNETSNAEETCIFNDGQTVLKADVNCEKRPGCKTIQKPNECCPEYQCECEKNGTVYGNGEKIIDDESNSCSVCYCQGGEISCSNVTCHLRQNCEREYYIKGRCCPEYENCPPSQQNILINTPKDNGTNDSVGNPSHTVFSLIDHSQTDETSATSTLQPSTTMLNNDNSGYKIKEITKVEEIRITNEKTKPIVIEVFPTDTTIYYSHSSEQPDVFDDTENVFHNMEGLKNIRQTNESNFNDILTPVADEEQNDEIPEESENILTSESTSESYTVLSSTATVDSVDISSTSTAKEIIPFKVNNGTSYYVKIGDQIHKVPGADDLFRGEDDSFLTENDSQDSSESSKAYSSSTVSPDENELFQKSTLSATSTLETLLSSSMETDNDSGFHTIYIEPVASDESLRLNDVETFDSTGSGSGSGSYGFFDDIVLYSTSEKSTPDTTISDEPGSGSDAKSTTALSSETIFGSGDEAIETVYHSGESTKLTTESSSEAFNTVYITSSSENPETKPAQETLVSAEFIPVHNTYIEDEENHELISPGYGKIPDDIQENGQNLKKSFPEIEGEISQRSNFRDSATLKATPRNELLLSNNLHGTNETKTEFNTTMQNEKINLNKTESFKSLLRSPGEPHLIPEWERNGTAIEEEDSSYSAELLEPEAKLEETFSVSLPPKVKQSNDILDDTVNKINHDAQGRAASSEEADIVSGKDVEPTTIKATTESFQSIENKVTDSVEELNGSNQSSSIVQYNPKEDAESLKYEAEEGGVPNKQAELYKSLEEKTNSDTTVNLHEINQS
ncbi:unnamed protein product [Diamesa hyperborea]